MFCPRTALATEPSVSAFDRAIQMSETDEWNDVYLAHAYPFLYECKLRYAFASHYWERFLVIYGMYGMHLLVLISIALAIVGGYRALARCDRFAPDGEAWLGVFARQVSSLRQEFIADHASLLARTAKFPPSSSPCQPLTLTYSPPKPHISF